MERSLIKDVLSEEHVGKTLSVCGWVKTKRESKGFAFLIISDGSTQDTLQLFIRGETPAFQQLPHCNTGAAICTTGILRQSPAKGQKFEMEIAEITVFGEADSDAYPLQKKGHTLEFLREISNLRPRTNTFGAVFRLRNILAAAVHEFLHGGRGVQLGPAGRKARGSLLALPAPGRAGGRIGGDPLRPHPRHVLARGRTAGLACRQRFARRHLPERRHLHGAGSVRLQRLARGR